MDGCGCVLPIEQKMPRTPSIMVYGTRGQAGWRSIPLTVIDHLRCRDVSVLCGREHLRCCCDGSGGGYSETGGMLVVTHKLYSWFLLAGAWASHLR